MWDYAIGIFDLDELGGPFYANDPILILLQIV
jgi:hypothetical protein